MDEETGEVLSAEPTEHPYVFPPVDLLKQGDSTVRITKEEVERNMQTLRSVLKSFNINIKEMAYSCGPTITRYEVRPESGTRVRQFTLLSDDIALGLAAKSGIRIEAPIPGKPPSVSRCRTTTPQPSGCVRSLIHPNSRRARAFFPSASARTFPARKCSLTLSRCLTS